MKSIYVHGTRSYIDYTFVYMYTECQVYIISTHIYFYFDVLFMRIYGGSMIASRTFFMFFQHKSVVCSPCVHDGLLVCVEYGRLLFVVCPRRSFLCFGYGRLLFVYTWCLCSVCRRKRSSPFSARTTNDTAYCCTPRRGHGHHHHHHHRAKPYCCRRFCVGPYFFFVEDAHLGEET